MLKVENVSKYYDDFKAVDNLSFEVKKEKYLDFLVRMVRVKQLHLE